VFDPGTGLPTTLTSSTPAGTTSTALDHQPGTHRTAAATSTGPGAASRTFTWQPDGTPATWTGPDRTTWTATSSTTGATTTLTGSGGPGGSTRVDRALSPDGTILAEHTTTPAGTSLLIDLGPIGRITITTSPDSQETVTGQRDQRRPDGTLAATRTGPALTDTTAWHTDTQGTPIAAAGTTMLDGTTPTGRRWWTAYGAPRGPPDTTSGPAATGWLGRPQHAAAQEATGLTRLGARDHDPTLGAFTTPDPVTAFGDPAALDPYTYARWNPLTYSDPTGLWPNWGKAKNTLAKAGAWAWKHKAAIAGSVAGIAVGAAACAVTAGLGCVLIGSALAGAAASATTYSIEAATGQRTWNTRDFLKTTLIGAALGLAGGAAGRLAATAARTLARTPAAIKSAATALRNDRGSFGLGGGGKPSSSAANSSITGTAAKSGDDLTRVGRWMSQSEYDMMLGSGRVIEGGGGRSYVVRPPNPDTYQPGKGVYAEFDVPTNSLHPAGGNPNYAVIPGPNAGTTRFGPLPDQMPPATCIELVCRR
jgi:RHS repeat-associated protein